MSSMPNDAEASVLLRARDLAFAHRAAPGGRAFELRVEALDVRAGEVLALCGPSGSGKSTLLAILAGLLPPHAGRVWLSTDEGTVSLYGVRKSEWRRRRRHLGFVHQDPRESLNDRRRVVDIVADPLRIHGLTEVPAGSAARLAHAIGLAGPRLRREQRARALATLGHVGLGRTLAERKPGALSGGQRQRVAIARALVADPRLIFLDEPTSALDVSVQASLIELLRGLRREPEGEGRAYVLVTHDLPLARQLADRVAILDDGRIVESGDADRLFRTPTSPITRALLGIEEAGLGGLAG